MYFHCVRILLLIRVWALIHFSQFLNIQMDSNYISSYLSGEDNLKLIQAISLWGNEDQKRQILSVKDEVEMNEFVRHVNSNTSIFRNTSSIRNSRKSIYIMQKIPYGNAFRMVFCVKGDFCRLSL